MEFNDLKAQQEQVLEDGRTIREAVNARIKSVLDHGKYILGPEVSELETLLASHVGVNHCIAVASGTDALLIALMALGIKRGDEVITTPFSFISTAETIALLGAIPVFIDIDARTYNLDASKIEKAITNNTKLILPVSLYGQPADFPAINAVAKRYSLPVLEDGAQSFGATQNRKSSCGLSTIGTTSFFPSKPLGAYGDGGACFTDDDELAEKIRRISRHGQTKRYFHTDIGLNGRIDTLQAAILLAKFEGFSKEIELRHRIGERYSKILNAAGVFSTPYISSENKSMYAQFTIEVNKRLEVQEFLKAMDIPTAVHYPTLLSKQPALKSIMESKDNASSTPVAKRACECVMSLPMHPYLSDEDQDRVATAVSKAVKSSISS